MAHQSDCMERQTIVWLIFSLNLGSFETVQRSASVQTSLLQCITCGTTQHVVREIEI